MKTPTHRIQQHTQRDTDFASDLMGKIKREGFTVKASPRVVANLRLEGVSKCHKL